MIVIDIFGDESEEVKIDIEKYQKELALQKSKEEQYYKEQLWQEPQLQIVVMV